MPEATGVGVLRSVSFTARCDKTREIPKNISGKVVPQEQAQILFNRVNFGAKSKWKYWMRLNLCLWANSTF